MLTTSTNYSNCIILCIYQDKLSYHFISFHIISYHIISYTEMCLPLSHPSCTCVERIQVVVNGLILGVHATKQEHAVLVRAHGLSTSRRRHIPGALHLQEAINALNCCSVCSVGYATRNIILQSQQEKILKNERLTFTHFGFFFDVALLDESNK
jgi:hypothetical protein